MKQLNLGSERSVGVGPDMEVFTSNKVFFIIET